MIAIVDDDESVCKSTSALVRSLGYAARTFAAAEEFLRGSAQTTAICFIDVREYHLIRHCAECHVAPEEGPIIIYSFVSDKNLVLLNYLKIRAALKFQTSDHPMELPMSTYDALCEHLKKL